ncbi:MAG: hypothetical protein EZS28_048010, partial [Streblomastix strix]
TWVCIQGSIDLYLQRHHLGRIRTAAALSLIIFYFTLGFCPIGRCNRSSSPFQGIFIAFIAKAFLSLYGEQYRSNHLFVLRAKAPIYKEGEQLYKQLAESTNLSQIAIDTLIADQNIETWKKRRAGHTPLAQYIKEKGIGVKDQLGIIPDIELVNALAWYKSRGGPKLQKRMKNMKMHCRVVLYQFSQKNGVNNFPLIKTFSQGQGLQIQSKARYPTIWNLQILFNYINTHQPLTSEEIQQTAMAMIVACCAARMTELVQMKVSEIVQEQHSITLQTHTSKSKQIIKHIFIFSKRIGRCCPVKTLLSWTAQREKDSIIHDQIWHNLSKKAPATPQYCSHQLTNIIRRAGIQSPYTGPTIRHAMMTRLRAAGATQPE